MGDERNCWYEKQTAYLTDIGLAPVWCIPRTNWEIHSKTFDASNTAPPTILMKQMQVLRQRQIQTLKREKDRKLKKKIIAIDPGYVWWYQYVGFTMKSWWLKKACEPQRYNLMTNQFSIDWWWWCWIMYIPFVRGFPVWMVQRSWWIG